MTNEEYEVFNAAMNGGMTTDVATLLVAQAKHESDGFTSPVYRSNNNAFGYKWVGQNGATQGTPAPITEGGYYAKYETLYDSADEIVRWWKRRIKEGKITGWKDINTAEKYAAALKANNYYGDTLANYTTALKRWLGDLLTPGSTNNVLVEAAIMLLGFAIAAYYIFK